MNIYRSFEQWKNSGFLEHGAPRTKEYTAEELHLVEMGWNYGYDAGRAVEQALDKKAENARELGLSYEPAPVQDLPFGVGGGLVAIKTLLSRDPWVHANTAIEMVDAILKEYPAAQPAPEEDLVDLAVKADNWGQP
jgi:hypothetical protein